MITDIWAYDQMTKSLVMVLIIFFRLTFIFTGLDFFKKGSVIFFAPRAFTLSYTHI